MNCNKETITEKHGKNGNLLIGLNGKYVKEKLTNI
jgi:hypothetical protein